MLSYDAVDGNSSLSQLIDPFYFVELSLQTL